MRSARNDPGSQLLRGMPALPAMIPAGIDNPFYTFAKNMKRIGLALRSFRRGPATVLYKPVCLPIRSTCPLEASLYQVMSKITRMSKAINMIGPKLYQTNNFHLVLEAAS